MNFPEIDAKSLPAKIDLRNYEGKNYVTPIKAQKYGDCWAFSIAAAAETSYLFANNMGVPTGEDNTKVNFSEKYIVWYVYHGITKDDVVKGRVRSSQVGDGIDPSQAESTNTAIVYSMGGPFVHGANLFGSGFGPADESVSVNGEHPYAYNEDSSVKLKLSLNAEYRNVPTNAFLRNSSVLPTPTTFDKDGNYVLNQEGIDAVKSELSQGRAVYIAVNATHSEINMTNMAAYYTGSDDPNHGVTVIGYDDNYPKEKFARNDTEGKVIEGSIPPSDGAFIIKNSWGKRGTNDFDDGYFYLSYYDHCIYSPESYEFDKNSPDDPAEVNFDQYDLMLTQWYGVTDHNTETKTANVFDAEEDEDLFRISYITASDKTQVIYEIYKNVENDDPSSGTLLEKGSNCHSFAGSHMIDLKDKYTLKKGEKYSVVLTMKRVTDDAGTMTYTEVFPYQVKFRDDITVNGVVNNGESYLYADGKWSDMSSMKDSLTDKAYKQFKDIIDSDRSLPEVKSFTKDGVAVDNYPIKAILAPKS